MASVVKRTVLGKGFVVEFDGFQSPVNRVGEALDIERNCLGSVNGSRNLHGLELSGSMLLPHGSPPHPSCKLRLISDSSLV